MEDLKKMIELMGNFNKVDVTAEHDIIRFFVDREPTLEEVQDSEGICGAGWDGEDLICFYIFI